MYDRYDLRRAGAVFVRILAAALLTGASACMGMYLRDRLRRRVRIWTQICLFLREVRLRARLHEPLDAQIEALSENRELESLTFLADCAARCRQGYPLPQAWTASVGAFAGTCDLSRAHWQMLMQCVPALSDADSLRVDALLDLYETRAAQALETAAQTDASVGPLCVRVCAAAGLLLGILIL